MSTSRNRENPEDGAGYVKLADFTDMAHRIEGAHAYQAAKASRQILYQFAKMVPAYLSFYAEAEDLYVRLCTTMGVDAEEVFDIDEYKKSQRYQDLVSGRIT